MLIKVTKKVKPEKNKKFTKNKNLTFLSWKALAISSNDLCHSIILSLLIYLFVSFKNFLTENALIKLISAAKRKGTVGLKKGKILESDKNPPKKGPNMKPIEKAAPINPKFLALFCGFVISATAACATEILPLATPATARDIKRSGMFL